jgi:hypothetical protein
MMMMIDQGVMNELGGFGMWWVLKVLYFKEGTRRVGNRWTGHTDFLLLSWMRK